MTLSWLALTKMTRRILIPCPKSTAAPSSKPEPVTKTRNLPPFALTGSQPSTTGPVPTGGSLTVDGVDIELSATSLSPGTTLAVAVSVCTPGMAPDVFQVKLSAVVVPAASAITLCGALTVPAVPPAGGVSVRATMKVSSKVPSFATSTTMSAVSP